MFCRKPTRPAFAQHSVHGGKLSSASVYQQQIGPRRAVFQTPFRPHGQGGVVVSPCALDIPDAIVFPARPPFLVHHHAHLCGLSARVGNVHAFYAFNGTGCVQHQLQTFGKGHIGTSLGGLARVAFGHVHESVFISIARRGDVHGPAPQIGKRGGKGGKRALALSPGVFLVRRAFVLSASGKPGNDHARRHRAVRAVKLTDKAQDQFVSFLQSEAGPEKGAAILHNALSHKNHAERKTVRAGDDSHDIHVPALLQHHALPFHGLFYRAQLIAQHGRPFKVQIFRGLFHALAKHVEQLPRLSFQQKRNSAGHVRVFLSVHLSGAGRKAQTYMMIQTGTHPVF